MTQALKTLVHRFCRSESGAAGIEYALIGGGIAILITASMTTIGRETNDTFTHVADSFPDP